MKKLIAVVLAAAMVMGLAACGGSDSGSGSASEATSGSTAASETSAASEEASGSTGGTEATASGVDMSAYPSDVSEWTAQNFVDYFTAVGLFTDDADHETWIQDHEMNWPNTPVSECAGWWDLVGTEVCEMIMIMSPDLADSSQEDYDSWIETITNDKTLPGEYSSLGKVDHLVGNVAFAYSTMTLDDDTLARVEAAYERFLVDTGATATF